jgi:DUF438 domain-containing protein
MEQIDGKILEGILDSIGYPVVFAGLDHVIRYMNMPAMRYFGEEKGWGNLVGKSLLDCHNPESVAKIKKALEHFKSGGGEVFEQVNKKGQRVYMTPVRDAAGNLAGYFERREFITTP